MGNHLSKKKNRSPHNASNLKHQRFGSDSTLMEKYMILSLKPSEKLSQDAKTRASQHLKSETCVKNSQLYKLTDFDELEDHPEDSKELTPSLNPEQVLIKFDRFAKKSNRSKFMEDRKKFIYGKRLALGTERLPNLNRLLSVDPVESQNDSHSVKNLIFNSYRGNKLSPFRRRQSRKSLVSHDLEKINFRREILEKTTKEALLLFSVPFHKRLIHVINYYPHVIKIKDFVTFYKSFDEKERVYLKKSCFFSKILRTFPTRWSDSVVPYFIDNSLLFIKNYTSLSIYNVIQQAIKEVEAKTFIKFVSYVEGKHSDFVYFEPAQTNSAFLGKVKGKNIVSVSKRAVKDDILHLIMHFLGFMHAHRKENQEGFHYLSVDQVVDKSFIDNKEAHFCIFGLKYLSFDLDSVLMKKSCEHMISYHSVDIEENGLSESDVLKVNFFYNNENFDKSEEEIEKVLEEMKKESLNESGVYSSISSLESDDRFDY